MKKQFKLMALASAVLLLGACADDMVLNPEQARQANPESNAIQFGTYMGKSTMTRAGYTGDITTDVLKDNSKANGFGVFAYYTEKNSYSEFQKKGANLYPQQSTKEFKTSDFIPNFMYNQHVYYDASNAQNPLITNWFYTPMKYWPNEVKANDVDDQNNDQNNDPATTPYEYGGNVSFFAYAPYVEVTATNLSTGSVETDAGAALTGTKFEGNSGILALTPNTGTGDPKVAYKIPAKGKTVDLLWGTKGNTDMNVNNENNAGVKGDNNPSNDAAALQYVHAILKNYALNADLTKQTTMGKVEFAFKHATSKVGGAYTGDGDGDDEDPKTPTAGLMIVLDLDKNGNEVGGVLEDWDNASEITDKLKYKTKVTVKTISIESDKSIIAPAANTTSTSGGVTTGSDGNTITIDYTNLTAADMEDLTNQGVFNLATGQWTNRVKTDDFKTGTAPDEKPGLNHYITSQKSSNDEKTNSSALLSEEIAEKTATVNSLATGQTNFKETQPIGVTTVPKNVYEGKDVAPLLFLPDQYPILNISVEYIVRTYDENLKYGYSEVTQKIKKRLIFLKKTELNKAYNLLIHLGLTSVKFEAFVSNWDSSDLTTSTTTDPTTGDVLPLYQSDEEVWNPINVAMQVTKLDVSGDPALTDDGDNYKIDLSSINRDIQLTVTADLKSDKGVNYTAQAVTPEAGYVSDVSWIHTTSDGKITVDEYKAIGAGDRTGTVTVKYGDKEKVITITQKGRSVTALALKLDGTNVDYTITDGKAVAVGEYTLVATVTDGVTGGYENTSYDATTEDYYLASNEDWAVVDKKNKKIVVTSDNTTGSDREATISARFYGYPSGSSTTATLKQQSGTLASIGANTTDSKLVATLDGVTKASAATYDFPAKGGTFSVQGIVANYGAFTHNGSNVKLSTSSSATWFTLTGNSIYIKPETTGTAHTTPETIKVSFKDENGLAKELTFTITQKAGTLSSISAKVDGTIYKDTDSDAERTITVPAAGKSYTVGEVLGKFNTDEFTRNAVQDGKVTVTANNASHDWVSFDNNKTITFGGNTTAAITASDATKTTMTITVNYSATNTKTIVLTFTQAVQ